MPELCLSALSTAMSRAIALAKERLGATAPNPPVGAVALDAQGRILASAAHPGAGGPHAEALLLETLKTQGNLTQAHSIVVTLEPCNHTGRTPPCTDALINAGIREVVYGARDPNPKVAGGGEEKLRAAGIQVTSGVMTTECQELISGFTMWVKNGRPWITLKRAFDPSGGMIPPAGQKTFTSEPSLKFAHELRRRSDAIMTGSGTVLADQPEFTVRFVADHQSRTQPRFLVVMDRRNRTPPAWLKLAADRGFKVFIEQDLHAAVQRLGQAGCHHLLIEGGPGLSDAVLALGLWDERFDIFSDESGDRIHRQLSRN